MAEKVKDPVCGMMIDKTQASATSQYKSKTYYFCTLHCKKQFEKEPQKYVKA